MYTENTIIFLFMSFNSVKQTSVCLMGIQYKLYSNLFLYLPYKFFTILQSDKAALHMKKHDHCKFLNR